MDQTSAGEERRTVVADTRAESATWASGGPEPGTGTLNELFFEAVEKLDMPDAMLVKSGGRYQPISHSEIAARVRRITAALHDAGLERGDRVAILSSNRPEWAICDYACLTGGFVTVPVYPSLPPDQIGHILSDSGSAAIFVADPSQAAKVVQIRGQLPRLRLVVTFAGMAGEGADATLAELEARGADLETPAAIEAHRSEALRVRPEELATIIYTSGTTGNPKGVMLTHGNLYSNVAVARTILPFEKDLSLSILPLSHVFERMAGHFLMFAAGATIAYAESIETVAANMLEVRPTFVISVPRLYEKLYARVLERARAGGPLKLRIFNWARGVSERWARVKLDGGTPRGVLAWQYSLADRLVFSKLRERTGGRLRYFVSGGAPLSPEINRFFYASGMVILEGYGLTETSPLLCVNTPAKFRIGTVGPPVAGVELKIASDGEILARGPNIMQGYYNNPEATAEAIDADGWFHTGDVGVLEDGFLRITDRKKDIIVTAGGKNIAPQNIENQVKTNEFVAEAVMIGDKRKYPVMLVVPDFARLGKWAAGAGLGNRSPAELIESSQVRSKMENEVAGTLRGLASFETPKKIALLEHEFSIDRGELTPSLKVKRKVIDEHYKSVIDSLYAGSD